MKVGRGLLLVWFLLLCAATSSAGTATKTYNVTGKVIGTPSGVLAPYGVQTNSTVTISWSVDLAKAPSLQLPAPDNRSDYYEAITFIVISIGSWSALLSSAPLDDAFNYTAVADNANGVLDAWHMTARGTDNDHVLHQNLFLNLSLDFYGYASAGSDQSLDQDPSRYYSGTGSALGPGGGVYFTIDVGGSGGGGGVVDPTANCRKAQLKAGGKLCKSELTCHSKYAKSPDADPLGAKRDSCLAKAEDGFTKAFEAAAAKAEDKGLECGTDSSAFEVLEAIGEQIDAVVAEVDAIQPSYPPLESAWLGAAGAACFSSLSAQSANAGKPNPDKLAGSLASAGLKLDSTAQKAADKAADKGVVFDLPLDIPAFHEVVDELINTATSELGAD